MQKGKISIKHTSTKRLMAWVLSAALIITQFSTPVYAQAITIEGNLCEHHTEHIDCGYIKGVACAHEHDENCGNAEAVEGTDCNHIANHDTACGYAEGSPCTFRKEQCELCAAKENGKQDTLEKACSCEFLCTEDLKSSECIACALDFSACQYKPQAPSLGKSSSTVIAFGELAKAVAEQTVPIGTTLEQLNLPTALAATGYIAMSDSDMADSGTPPNATPAAITIDGNEGNDTFTPIAISIEGVAWELDPANDINEGNSTYNPAEGVYCFTPILPEAYTLAEGVALPEIWVMVSGAALLVSSPDEFIFDISEGNIIIAAGTDADTLKISYGDSKTLDNVLQSQQLTIIGATTTNQMEVNTGTQANPVKLIFDNLKIDRAGNVYNSFIITGAADIELKTGTSNILRTGHRAGIDLGDNAYVKIGGEGSLDLLGMGGSIGGFASATAHITSGTIKCGDIGNVNLAISGGDVTIKALNDCTISGGNVTIGTLNGGTISGGDVTIKTLNDCTISGGNVTIGASNGGTISGGTIAADTLNGCTISGDCTITATRLNRGTISGGDVTIGASNGGTISGGTITADTLKDCTISEGTITADTLNGGTISGGTITATTITGYVTISAGKTATFNGEVTNKGRVTVSGTLNATGATWTNAENGNLYKITGGTIDGLTSEKYIELTDEVPCGDLWVKGGVMGTDYTYSNNTLTILSDTPIIISMAGGVTSTSADKIFVPTTNTNANITLDGVDIDMGRKDYTTAFELQGNAKVSLTLIGTNVLKGGSERAGLQVQTTSEATAELIITAASTGSLNATGGSEAAGIGGSRLVTGGIITIEGGTVTATGGSHGAGIGGGLNATSDTITIKGGIVTATGGTLAAGIGGGSGIGGIIIIEGGTVIATGGESGAGIGNGSGSGSSTSFSTGASGNAFILAETISDQTGKGSWGGVIFEGNTGAVYGSPTLKTDAEIPAGKTLTIGTGQTLTIGEGVTLNNRGTIANSGTFTNNGTFNNYGTIDNPPTGGTINKPSQVAVTFRVKTGEGYGEPVTAATYGDTIQITATTSEKTAAASNRRKSTINTVDFYHNSTGIYGKYIGTAPVIDGAAKLEIALTNENGFLITNNTIEVDFGGSAGLVDSTGRGILTVKAITQTADKVIVSKNDPAYGDPVLLTITPVEVVGGVGVTYSAVTSTANGAESDVASINPNNNVITINKVGTFYVKAVIAGTTHYEGKTIYSDAIIVEKGTLRALPKYEMNFIAEHGGSGSLDIKEMLREYEPIGCELSTITDDNSIISNAAVGGGILTFKVKKEEVGYTATIAVGVSFENYNNARLNVKVTLVKLANATISNTNFILTDDTCSGECTGHIITGSTTSNKIVVESGTHNITLNDVTIRLSGDESAAFELKGNAKVNLTLIGTNVLESGRNKAGLQVPNGTTITIDGTGSLKAASQRGAGIGGGIYAAGGTITISGNATIEATSVEGAGIGGGHYAAGGTITISGGTIKATSVDGAGIGGGHYGAGGTTIISGGTIKATSTKGAGIGGGNGEDTYGTIEGSGAGGIITISGNADIEADSTFGAGIGGGNYAAGGDITISDGTITATSKKGAGIGGSYQGAGGTITISGNADIEADSTFGAGIGGGYNGAGGDITISAGTIKATSIANAPKNTSSAPVFLGKLDFGSVTSVSVGNNPYYISENHKDDTNLFLYMTGRTHTVHVKKIDGMVHTYTAAYSASEVSSGGYFTFTQAGTATTPSTESSLGLDKDVYRVTHGTATQAVIVTLNPVATLKRSRSLTMNSVSLSLTKKDDSNILWTDSQQATGTSNTFAVDTSKLELGKYTLKAVYGGSVTDMSSTMTATLIVLSDPSATHTITASAGIGGTISPNGSVSLASGDDKTFIISANSGYSIAGVVVDNVEKGAIGTYTFDYVTGNHTISATFIKNHTINASAGTGGTISPNGSVDIASGESKTFMISANSGYSIAGVVVDNVEKGAIGTYTFDNVTGDHTISATFIKNHTINASAGIGGTISPNGSVSLASGESKTFMISANSGYSIAGVVVDNVEKGAIGTYTFDNVTGDHTISASFSYNGGDGDGDSGGGGGGGSNNPPSPTPPSVNDPTPPIVSDVKPPVTLDGNGNAITKIPDNKVQEAIQKAVEQAKKDGTTANGIAISVVLDVKTTANSLTADLSRTTLDRLIAAKVEHLSLTSGFLNLRFDLEALKQLQSQSNGEVAIKVLRQDVKKLSPAAQAAIGNRPAMEITASWQNNGKLANITSFGKGSVAVGIPYTKTATEQTGYIYGVYVDGKGNVTYITNSSFDTGSNMLMLTTNHLSVYGVGYKAPTTVFTDTARHWARDDIDFVAARGLLSGTSNTAFSPDTSMTRGMLATALGKLANVNVNSYKMAKFTDVKANVDYAPYVNWAAEKGIMNGTTNTIFSPDKAITRQEMAVMIVNYSKAIGYKVPETRTAVTYADSSSIASEATTAVKQMQMAGVLMGKSGNRFDPTATATRAEASAMLRRYLELAIDRTSAEGWATNDSGNSMYYQSGKPLTGTRTIGNVTYSFNAYGEVANTTPTPTNPPPTSNNLTHIVRKNEYFGVIAEQYGCTTEELLTLNGKKYGDVIHVGDELKLPQK